MRILDPACSARMFWFDKQNPLVTFGDIRRWEHRLIDGRNFEVKPDAQMDFKALPFADSTFDLVVFDPPHLISGGETGWMVQKYGKLPDDWQHELASGFTQCFRVLKEAGILVFKWNATQVVVSEVIKLAGREPLLGHRSGKASNTHWLLFSKP